MVKLPLPIRDLVGMHLKLFCEFRDRLVAFQSRRGDLCFEYRTVISTLPSCGWA
jgi:hypothetical protein